MQGKCKGEKGQNNSGINYPKRTMSDEQSITLMKQPVRADGAQRGLDAPPDRTV